MTRRPEDPATFVGEGTVAEYTPKGSGRISQAMAYKMLSELKHVAALMEMYGPGILGPAANGVRSVVREAEREASGK